MLKFPVRGLNLVLVEGLFLCQGISLAMVPITHLVELKLLDNLFHLRLGQFGFLD